MDERNPWRHEEAQRSHMENGREYLCSQANDEEARKRKRGETLMRKQRRKTKESPWRRNLGVRMK